MELSEKNGHASIEEILASVRRIIAEEPASANPLIDLQTPAAARVHPKGDGLLDDPSDFDLPSMFKTPTASTSEKPAPLFGRLSEAIRAASSGSGYAGDRFDQSLSTLQLHRAEATETTGAPNFLLSTFHDATAHRVDEAPSSHHYATALARTETTAPTTVMAASADDGFTTPAANDAASAATSPPQVPRQMAAFKDTRFRGMGSSPAALEPLQPAVSPFEAAATDALVAAADRKADVAPLLAAADPQAVATSPVDVGMSAEAPSTLAAAIAASYPALAVDVATPEPSLHVPPPVPHPAQQPQVGSAGLSAPAPIEDSTADLLRPMLRQWLAENMPRMVEKALHIEVAESVKSTKK
jgi:cell pole-organizing protein PopZ